MKIIKKPKFYFKHAPNLRALLGLPEINPHQHFQAPEWKKENKLKKRERGKHMAIGPHSKWSY